MTEYEKGVINNMEGLLFIFCIIISLWILRPSNGLFFQSWSKFNDLDSGRDFMFYIETLRRRFKNPIVKLGIAYVIFYLIYATFV